MVPPSLLVKAIAGSLSDNILNIPILAVPLGTFVLALRIRGDRDHIFVSDSDVPEVEAVILPYGVRIRVRRQISARSPHCNPSTNTTSLSSVDEAESTTSYDEGPDSAEGVTNKAKTCVNNTTEEISWYIALLIFDLGKRNYFDV